MGNVKNSVGNGEAKDLIYVNHGHKLKGGFLEEKVGTGWKGEKGEIGTTAIAKSIKYIFF